MTEIKVSKSGLFWSFGAHFGTMKAYYSSLSQIKGKRSGPSIFYVFLMMVMEMNIYTTFPICIFKINIYDLLLSN